MNEEEIKIKLVIPWLREAGADVADLQLERSFTIRLGRSLINSESATGNTRRGRLDILVRSGDKNLFIVETKAGSGAITDADRDQAVSYARLVHPIAPYAVVTNGHEHRLYDSITKASIDPSELRIRGFEASLPEAARVEAQAYFLRLNRANLLVLCREQVDSELRRVRGELSEGKKYVPAVHVARESFKKDVDSFYASSSPGLLLTGPSGTGKTCELCHLAETLLRQQRAVFFFNGSVLPHHLLGAIASEFLWSFNQAEGPIQILRRMESVLGDEPLTVIIDAVDEWTSPSRIAQLDELLHAGESHRIKLIIGCKSSAAPAFLTQRDTQTFIDLLARKTTLAPLTEKELYDAVENYREAYGFSGGFEQAVLNRARENLFLLRVFFDVARSSTARHLTFSSEEFFRRYYERVLSKIGREWQAEADATLRAVARLLWERNSDSIAEPTVRGTLGLRFSEPLLPDLFENNLLVRAPGRTGEHQLGFYFQQLRDYLIAFPVLQFNQLSESQLRETFEAAQFPSMRGDVLTLYYRLAPRARQRIFDGELRDNAAHYLACYRSLMDEHFPALRAIVEPRMDRPVGFIGELLLARRGVGLYGFRHLENGDDGVHFVPVDQFASRSNLSGLEGAQHGLHFRDGCRWFRDGIDIRAEVVGYEILPRIKTLINEARLNESSTPDLLVEQVIETVRNDRKIFGSLLERDRAAQIRCPLKLASVLDCLQREKLRRHFEDEIVQRGRRSGAIQEHWRGSTVSFSYSQTPEDKAEVARKVDQAMATGERPQSRTRYLELESLERTLTHAIEALRTEGEEISGNRYTAARVHLYTNGFEIPRNTLKQFLRDLTLASERNYRALVEVNFPTLRDCLPRYRAPPDTHFFVLGAPAVSLHDWRLTIYSTTSKSGTLTIEFPDEVIALTTSAHPGACRIDGVEYDGMSVTWTSVGRYIAGNCHFGESYLRSRVYGELAEDWAAVEQALVKSLQEERPEETPKRNPM